MKAALILCIVVLTFVGITQTAGPDAKAPLIFIQTRFVELSERTTTPPGDAPLPAPLDSANKVPGLHGTLSDPEFQKLLRNLSQRKGVDLLSAPSVTARSGQEAKVEVVRDFGYPDEAERQATTEIGVFFAVVPRRIGDNQIALDMSSKIVEFEGFEESKHDREEAVVSRKVLHKDGTSTESASDVEKGEMSESKLDARGVLLSSKRVPLKSKSQPIFSERKGKANVEMASGRTMVVEMDSKTDKQTIEETDERGSVISSRIELTHRRVWAFVTAQLVDPATGKPLVTKQKNSIDK